MNITEIAKYRFYQFEERIPTPKPIVRTQNFRLPVELIARLNTVSDFLMVTKTSILEDALHYALIEFENVINDSQIKINGITAKEYAVVEESRLTTEKPIDEVA